MRPKGLADVLSRLFHLGQRLDKRDDMALISGTPGHRSVSLKMESVQEKGAVLIFKKLCTLVISQD